MGKTSAAVRFTEEVLRDFLQEHGLSLYHAEYVKQGKDWYLNVFIEVADGSRYVGTEDCEMVSRYLDEKLDESDVIKDQYYLVVCSPGMDRILYEPADYERFTGELVDVRLYQAACGSKEHQGELLGIRDGKLVIREVTGKKGETREVEFPMDMVVKTSLAVVF